MTNYNLTFNEAIMAGDNGSLVQCEFNKSIWIYSPKGRVWKSKWEDEDGFSSEDFNEEHYESNWRIISNGKKTEELKRCQEFIEFGYAVDCRLGGDEESEAEKESYHIMHEERINWLEEKVERLEAMLKINDKDSYGGTE